MALDKFCIISIIIIIIIFTDSPATNQLSLAKNFVFNLRSNVLFIVVAVITH